jgi:Zn-dependent protease/predicted transcriptional regulator
MNWSWQLGRFRGIELFVHWTFLIVVGWIVILSIVTNPSWLNALFGIGLLLSIFACVVLHELGHALVAERLGVRTLDVTLLPIGGIARLAQLPQNPKEELKISLAGPAVNLAIALGLQIALNLLEAVGTSSGFSGLATRFLTQLMWINVGLTAFNLLPAFPLDGGRILRSLLSMRLDPVEATRFAAALGKAFAIAIGLVGLFFNWMLLLVAVFVYFGADHEAQIVDSQEALRGLATSYAMMTRFHVLSHNDTLEKAANDWFDCSQPDFPVVDHGRLVGVLDCGHLIKALAEIGPHEHVGNVMERDWPVAEDSDALEATFQKLREEDHALLPVVHHGRLVGVVTMQSIGKCLKVHSA